MLSVIVEQVERGVSVPKLILFYVSGVALGIWLNIALARKPRP